jgi:7-alpha-hydroxysteroid dehydrogenase
VTAVTILSKFQLTDRVAVVTGAGRGIGKGIALAFAEAGAHVVAVARTLEEIEATACEVLALGRKALPVPADVRDGQQVQGMVDKTLAEFGRIDILVNNVGGAFPAHFMEISERAWDAVLRQNLKTCFLCSQAVLKPMIEQKKGCIVNISSGTGRMGTAGLTHYGAAKAAVINLTKALAEEFACYNIRVNCIAPGPVATESASEVMQKRKDAIMSTLLIKRLGTPQDIASAAVYLASDAAAWVTGKTLEIDGGLLFAARQI